MRHENMVLSILVAGSLFLPAIVRADTILITAPSGVITEFGFSDDFPPGEALYTREVVFTASIVNVMFEYLTGTPPLSGIPDSFRITTDTDFNSDGFFDEAIFADNTVSGVSLNFFGDFGPLSSGATLISGSVSDNFGSADPYTASGSFTISGLSSSSPTKMFFDLINSDPDAQSVVFAKVEPVATSVPVPATLLLLGTGLAGLCTIVNFRLFRQECLKSRLSDQPHRKPIN